MSEQQRYDYSEREVASATVLSVVPYADGAEYREYEVSGEELPDLLEGINHPEVWEMVVDVDVSFSR